VLVTFRKLVEQRLASWEAVRGKRTRVPGTAMALGRGDLPHDLIQLVVESALRIEHGFWGCVADGATFKSLGRKRTRPGRAVIASHRADLDRGERLVGEHVGAWRAGAPTPAATALGEMERLWRALPDGGTIVVEWPSGRVVESSAPSPAVGVEESAKQAFLAGRRQSSGPA
jgi:hypothetical protein